MIYSNPCSDDSNLVPDLTPVDTTIYHTAGMISDSVKQVLLSELFTNSVSSGVCEGLIVYTLVESIDLPLVFVSGASGYVSSTLSAATGVEYKAG